MNIEVNDLIGYGGCLAAIIGFYYKMQGKHNKLSDRQDQHEKEIMELNSKLKSISDTHIVITNGMVRLTDNVENVKQTIENFKQESYNQWERTDKTLEKTSECIDKIFDKFEQLDKNIALFYKENGHVFVRPVDAKKLG